MRPLAIRRLMLYVAWLALIVALYGVGYRGADAAPPACQISCACKQVNAYGAVGANPVDPVFFYSLNNMNQAVGVQQAIQQIAAAGGCAPVPNTALGGTNVTIYTQTAPMSFVCDPGAPPPGITFTVEYTAPAPFMVNADPPPGIAQQACVANNPNPNPNPNPGPGPISP